MKQLTHNELKAITEPGHYRAGETLTDIQIAGRHLSFKTLNTRTSLCRESANACDPQGGRPHDKQTAST